MTTATVQNGQVKTKINVPRVPGVVSVIELTPALARQYLGKNTHNRNVRKGKVEAYARDMRLGRWVFNGEPIQIGKDGALHNGQHRCLAVIMSGVTIPCVVVTGLDAKAQETIDIGATRSAGDALTLRGESDATILAAVTRAAWLWDAGQRDVYGGKTAYTNADLYEYVDSNPLVKDAATVARACAGMVPVRPSIFGLVYFLAARVDRADARLFFIDQVAQALGVQVYSPAFALRRTFTSLSGQGQSRKSIQPVEVLGYSIKAWNLYRGGSGDTVKNLRAPTKTGWTGSNIPDPQ